MCGSELKGHPLSTSAEEPQEPTAFRYTFGTNLSLLFGKSWMESMNVHSQLDCKVICISYAPFRTSWPIKNNQPYEIMYELASDRLQLVWDKMAADINSNGSKKATAKVSR